MRCCALVLAVAVALAAVRGTGAQPAKGDGPTTLAAGFGSVWVGTGRGELFRIDPRTGRVQKPVRKEPGQIGYVADVVAGYGAVWVSDAGPGIVRLDPRRAGPPKSVFPAVGGLAVGAGAVWGVNPWRDEVLRIDPARARVFARIAMPGRLWGMEAGPAGVVIVHGPATDGPVFGPEGHRVLQRVDLRTNRATGPAVPLDCFDVSFAVGRDAVWTSDSCTGRLDRRDMRSLQSTASVELAPATHFVLAFGSVWLIGGSEVIRVDPETMRVLARIPVRASSAAADGSSLWLLDLGDGRNGFVRRLDPRGNRVVGREIRLPP